MFGLPHLTHTRYMTGTRDSLSAMIGQLAGDSAVRRRILQTIFPLLLTLPWRINFKQLSRWSDRNEGTLHNWFRRDLELVDFQRSLIDRVGSGTYCVLFDPSYLPKSGKKSPFIGHFWSGQARAVKRGQEISAFAVGDLTHHTAFHLSATLTPSVKELKQKDSNLMAHYVSQVQKNIKHILHFGGFLAADGYFGVSTFVNPVLGMGIGLISSLKSNAALHYPPPQKDKRGRGRPPVKGEKVRWNNIDEAQLPLVCDDAEKRVRTGRVWVKCLGRIVKLVSVQYLKEDGSVQCHKLYFCTDSEKDWQWILERYGLRFQIEFLFRDAKQFTGLTHCQSTNEVKLENHINLSLGAVSVAKAAHWLPLEEHQRGPFSMAELKTYYHNLAMVERISIALDLDPTETKNNPKIKELLFSITYAEIAA
jgi:hypothetical protein